MRRYIPMPNASGHIPQHCGAPTARVTEAAVINWVVTFFLEIPFYLQTVQLHLANGVM
jgi:hypothetical protein